jgi:S-DNA-T family DNA segregation ATPase FtsK/SpoIIIE
MNATPPPRDPNRAADQPTPREDPREPRPDDLPTRPEAQPRETPEPDTEDTVYDAEIVDAEIVDELPDPDPPATPGAEVATRAGVLVPVRAQVIRAVAVTRTVATHERTHRSLKCTGRNLWYPVAGVGVVYKQWRDAHGVGRYERMMRQAELTGNLEMLGDWEARDTAEKQRRHDRVMDWVHSPIQLIRAAALFTAATVGLLLALGIILAIAHRDIGEVLGPISAVISAIAFVCWFLSVYGATMLLVATAAGIAGLWHLGRTRTDAPGWIATPAEGGPDRELIPDEGAILAALRNLNLPVLNRKFKEGWQPRWPLATGRDGKGYRTQLELPAGVTVEMINQRKDVLAHNLVRLPVEVWPTEPKKQPGVLDLWVADPGLLTSPVEPYPLLTAGECDYFKGVPAGVDQRGELIHGRLMASNYAIAGTMGSGKTSAVIELLCGAMLDPLVDIEVYVMAYNVDYDPLKPRLSVLVKGDEDEQIVATMQALQSLREEVTQRGKILAELGGEETKLTREIAERDPRMRPRVVVVDECQELFRHDQHGQMAKELAIKLMMKARKVGITLIFVTPAPSADSLPRELAKTVSHRMCFAIGDHQGNDAILGTGAHKRGITAVNLVPGEDIGTAMCSGFGPKPGLVRTHHIRKDKEVDQLTPIVQRAMELREGVPLAVVPDTVAAEAEPDPLADVAAVLAAAGAELMRTQEVIAALAARNRRFYSGWTFAHLREALPEAAKPYKTKGQMQVSAARVAEALADRDLYDADDAAEDTEQDAA